MKIVGYEKSDKGYFYKKVKENNEIKKIRITADEYLKKKKIQKGGVNYEDLSPTDKNLWDLDNLIYRNCDSMDEIKFNKIIEFINNKNIKINYNYILPNNIGTILLRIITNISEKNIKYMIKLFIIIFDNTLYKNFDNYSAKYIYSDKNIYDYYLEILNNENSKFSKDHNISIELNNLKNYIKNKIVPDKNAIELYKLIVMHNKKSMYDYKIETYHEIINFIDNNKNNINYFYKFGIKDYNNGTILIIIITAITNFNSDILSLYKININKFFDKNLYLYIRTKVTEQYNIFIKIYKIIISENNNILIDNKNINTYYKDVLDEEIIYLSTKDIVENNYYRYINDQLKNLIKYIISQK